MIQITEDLGLAQRIINDEDDYSQLPKDICAKGKDARQFVSKRQLGFIPPFVEHPADNYQNG